MLAGSPVSTPCCCARGQPLNRPRPYLADADPEACGRGPAEGESEAVAGPFDDGPDADAVDGAGNVVPLLGASDLVGVERDGHQQLARPRGSDHDGETLRLHGHRSCHW